MIATIMVAALLGQIQEPPCFNCLQVSAPGLGAKATATVNLRLEIESQHLASTELVPLGFGAYRLVMKETVTGDPDAFHRETKALVWDAWDVGKTQEAVRVAFVGGKEPRIQHHELVAVYQWPGEATDKEAVAMLRGAEPLEWYKLARMIPIGEYK